MKKTLFLTIISLFLIALNISVVFACEPTPPPCPSPTPEITPSPTPEITPGPTEEPAPQPCNGCGGWPGVPSCGATKPSTPTLLSVVRHGSTADLTWTAATPVTHYSLVYGIKEGEYIYGAVNIGNVTSYTVGSLDPGTKYFFQVRAVNDCMPSDPSTTGEVLGAVYGGIGGGDVLGLASTGNSFLIYLLLSAGTSFFVLSLASFRLQGREA
jgi:hypothetical protein